MGSGALAVAVWLAAALPAYANHLAARDLLEQRHGLVDQRGRWLLPLEIALRQKTSSLPDRRDALHRTKTAAEQTYRDITQQNATVQKLIRTLETRLRLRQAQDVSDLGPGQRRLLAEQTARERSQLESLRGQAIDLAQIGGVPLLKKQVIELTNRRNELAIAILAIHDDRIELARQYEELSAEPQVAAALKAVGNDQQLGPLEDYNGQKFLTKLAGYEREVFTNQVPLYRDNGQLRVSGLIGRTPVTFTWLDSSEPTMLTASVIESAGLQVPENAPRVKRHLADGREVMVTEFEIPYLRFGNRLLRGVKAYALPPEAENVGTQIGPAAFEDLTPKAEPHHLRLVLD